MCGRYSQTLSWAEVAALFRLGGETTPLNLAARYNVAPTQDVPIVRSTATGAADAGRELVNARWGLIPSWARDASIGYKMINARAETVAEKPAFRQAFRRRRCLVVASGFYEWRDTEAGKQPYFITLADGQPFALAGLWEHWRGAGGEAVENCTIVVTAANALMRPIHDRMPVILTPEHFDAWLDTGRPLAATHALLGPYAGWMTLAPVSPRVNGVRNDDPACQEPVGPAITAAGTTALSEGRLSGSAATDA